MNTFEDALPLRLESDTELKDVWKQIDLNLDYIIEQLTDRKVLRGERACISECELVELANRCGACFHNEPVCLQLQINQHICIVGDIFGQYNLLVHLFKRIGYPPRRTYLFLGNCVNRGRRSVETICLLFALKLKYPNNIYILRGIHECHSIAYYYGLHKECGTSFNQPLWEALNNAFNYLPAVAVIENLFFCVSSGIPYHYELQNLTSQEELITYISNRIFRPNSVFNCDMMTQLAWSEPGIDSFTWKPNEAGLGCCYPESAVEEFCDKFGFHQVIRSNSLLSRGYEFMANSRLLTIYSSPYTFGHWRGVGAVAILSQDVAVSRVIGRIVLLHFDTLAAIGRPNVLNIVFTDSLGDNNMLTDILGDRVSGGESFTEYEIADREISTFINRRLTTVSVMADGCCEDEHQEIERKYFLPDIHLHEFKKRTS